MCPRCTETECLPHRTPKSSLYKPISSNLHLEWTGRRTIPLVSHRIEIEHPSKPCGGNCILQHQLVSLSVYISRTHSSDYIQIPFEWPDALVDELRDLVSHGFLTANPCDLGVVMRQPCWQVCTPLACFWAVYQFLQVSENLKVLAPFFSTISSQDDMGHVEPPLKYSPEMVQCVLLSSTCCLLCQPMLQPRLLSPPGAVQLCKQLPLCRSRSLV